MDKTSFRSRSHNAFGSLSPLLSSSTSSSSIDVVPLRFLPDNGVKKRQVRSPFENRVEDHDEIDDYLNIQETNSKNVKDVCNEVDALIGLDSILDNEEEGDKYDRIAEGRGISSSSPALPTSFQDVYGNIRTDHVAAQIRLKEGAEETYNDDESLSEGITEASEDNFQSKSTFEGKEDADTAAVMSPKFIPFNQARDHECKTPSNENQGLKPILKRKANGNRHTRGTKSVKNVSFHDLACNKDLHGAKELGDATGRSRKHVTFDLACKDDGKWTPKNHQGLKSIAERKIRMKNMRKIPGLNPDSLSVLNQHARFDC